MANDLHRPMSSIDGIAPVSPLNLFSTLVDDGCAVPGSQYVRTWSILRQWARPPHNTPVIEPNLCKVMAKNFKNNLVQLDVRAATLVHIPSLVRIDYNQERENNTQNYHAFSQGNTCTLYLRSEPRPQWHHLVSTISHLPNYVHLRIILWEKEFEWSGNLTLNTASLPQPCVNWIYVWNIQKA